MHANGADTVSEQEIVHITYAMLNGSFLWQGSIDQVDNLIYFDTNAKELQHWDNQIQAVCSQINQIMEHCVAKKIEAV